MSFLACLRPKFKSHELQGPKPVSHALASGLISEVGLFLAPALKRWGGVCRLHELVHEAGIQHRKGAGAPWTSQFQLVSPRTLAWVPGQERAENSSVLLCCLQRCSLTEKLSPALWGTTGRRGPCFIDEEGQTFLQGHAHYLQTEKKSPASNLHSSIPPKRTSRKSFQQQQRCNIYKMDLSRNIHHVYSF